MDSSLKKAMTRDETALLVDLITACPALTTKQTNASTNKIKEEKWEELTSVFNAKCGSIPRTKAQLKLKWDNLKKTARKRSQQIRMNSLKTGGGKGDFIPPDDILEKVSGVLGTTCTGFEVPFGGDGVVLSDTPQESDDVMEDVAADDARADAPCVNFETPSKGSQVKKMRTDLVGASSSSDFNHFFGGPKSKLLGTPNKGKKKADSDGRLARNLAIAKYYEKKTEKLELEIKLLKTRLPDD